MMKRQFIQINPLRGKTYYPGQGSQPAAWLPGDAQPGDLSAQPQEGLPSAVSHHPGIRAADLLSDWNPAGLQDPISPAPSIVEQDTLEQPVMRRPITEPTFNTGFAAGWVSPHESAISPLSPIYPNSQTLQPFSSQPLSPLAGPNSQILQPFGSQPLPGQAPAAWQRQPLWPQDGQAPPGQAPANMQRKNRRKKSRVPIWARVVLAVVLVLLIAVGSVGGYYYYILSAPISKITGQTVVRVKGDDNPNSKSNSGGPILSGGRINILLLGSDDDYKSVHIYGGILAQTDIVITIDPATKSVGMLSIPRDSWVNVPGFGMHKLDQAYLLGGGGKSGAALAMATIHQDFGIYIDHYAWVGLSGFAKVIDTVNGIDVDVIHPITDDAYPDDTNNPTKRDYYAVRRLYIAPGPQHLNGLQALEYVRSRHADLVGDFGRSVRQQQILNQLKYKLDNPDIFGKLPGLANDLSGYVTTDMQLPDVLLLMNFAKSLDQSKINRVTLGPPYSGDSQVNTPAGQQDVVTLNCGLVQPLIAKMFALGNKALCNTQTNSSNSSSAAYASQTSPVSDPTDNPWQVASQMANMGTMRMSGGDNSLFGLRSLLDLEFLVVFESPIGLQA